MSFDNESEPYFGMTSRFDKLSMLIQVKEFSDESIHSPRGDMPPEEFYAYLFPELRFPFDYESFGFEPKVRANGHNMSTEGFVSILLFNRIPEIESCVRAELTLVIAVIDAEGDRRFSQSFLFLWDRGQIEKLPQLDIDKYISRRVLLESPSEFLPNDTLTLHLEGILVHQHSSYGRIKVFPTGDYKTRVPTFKKEHDSYFLFLDYPLARRLREESAYFNRISDSPMLEGTSRWMKIPNEEYDDFKTIEELFGSDTMIVVPRFTETLRLYDMANKYFIESVKDVCREWLQDLLTDENAAEISHFAEEHGDSLLKGIVEDFQKGKGKKIWAVQEIQTGFRAFTLPNVEVADSRNIYDFYT